MQVGSLEVIDETHIQVSYQEIRRLTLLNKLKKSKKKTSLKLCDNSDKSNRYVILSLFYEIYKKNCYVNALPIRRF